MEKKMKGEVFIIRS